MTSPHHDKHKPHSKKPAQSGKDLEGLKTRIKELEDGWRRTQADFENFRRHTETQRQENAKFGTAQMMLRLVPILDNFRRAADHIPAEQKETDWVKGIQLIEKQLEDAMSAEGLERISGEGEFNPHLHEAISHEPNPTIAQDHVIAVVESGWKVGDKVLKPAKVRVSSGPQVQKPQTS